MYDYGGQRDPCHLNDWEISQSELKSRIHFVIHVPMNKISLSVVVEPFHWGHRPDNVSVGAHTDTWPLPADQLMLSCCLRLGPSKLSSRSPLTVKETYSKRVV